MQGILKSFEPKVVGEVHYNYPNKRDNDKPMYGFIVHLETDLKPISGEAFSPHTTGSKAWKLGKIHEYSKKENDRAEGGYTITGLKCIEEEQEQKASPSGGKSLPHDMVKESFVISRFAHQAAIDYLNSLPEKDRVDIIKGLAEKDLKELSKEQVDEIIVNAGRKYVSKVAKSMAESVDEIAILVQKSHEGRDK